MSVYNCDLVFKTLERSALDDILRIEHDVHLAPWSQQKFLACFADDLYLNKGLYEKKCLVGYVVLFVTSPEAELHNFAISKTFLNRGYGTLLLNHLIRICAQMKLEKIFLEVRESNTNAINVYKKSGFIQIGSRKDYYRSETLRESALIFMLQVS